MRSARRCWLITKVVNSVELLSNAYVMCEHVQEVDNGEITNIFNSAETYACLYVHLIAIDLDPIFLSV